MLHIKRMHGALKPRSTYNVAWIFLYWNFNSGLKKLMGDQDLAITVDVVVSRRFCVFNEKNQPENKYILCHKRMYWYVGKIRSYIFMNAFFRFIKEIIKNYLNIKSRSYWLTNQDNRYNIEIKWNIHGFAWLYVVAFLIISSKGLQKWQLCFSKAS